MAKDRLIAPPLEPIYSTFVEREGGRIRVYGHESRCKALLYYWEQLFEIDPLLPEIRLIDIAPNWFGGKNEIYPKVSENSFSVEITDVQALACFPPHLIINYQVGAGEWFQNDLDRTEVLLGEDYFFFAEDSLGVTGYSQSDEPSVVVIPNGNQDWFFKNFDVAVAHRVVSESFAGSLTVINHVEKETLLDHLATASIVVTTPSVTAMECLSIGLPVLLIKTSNDQTGCFVESGLAGYYSPEVLGFLLENKVSRMAMAMNGRERVRNNIVKVADKILASYTEWYANGTGMKNV